MAVVVSVVEFGVSGGDDDDDDERQIVVVVADGDTGGDTVAVAPRRGGDTGGAHCLSHRFRRRYRELKALELYQEERNTS